MIGLDTNVVVRHITNDDPVQSRIANQVFDGLTDKDPGYLSFPTVLEVYWVLRQAYRYPRNNVHELFDALLATADLVIENADSIRRGLTTAVAIGRELPDVLIAQSGQQAGCDVTLTFDQAALSIPGMASPQRD